MKYIVLIMCLFMFNCGGPEIQETQSIDLETSCPAISDQITLMCDAVTSGPCKCNDLPLLIIHDFVGDNWPSAVNDPWTIQSITIAPSILCAHSIWVNDNLGESIIASYDNNMAAGIFFPSTGPICDINFKVEHP